MWTPVTTGSSRAAAQQASSGSLEGSPTIHEVRQKWQQRVDKSIAQRESELYAETDRELAKITSQDRQTAERLKKEQEQLTAIQLEVSDEAIARALQNEFTQEINNTRRCSIIQEEADLVLARELQEEMQEGGNDDHDDDVGDNDDQGLMVAQKIAQEKEDERLAARLAEEEPMMNPEERDDMLFAMNLQKEQLSVPPETTKPSIHHDYYHHHDYNIPIQPNTHHPQAKQLEKKDKTTEQPNINKGRGPFKNSRLAFTKKSATDR